MAEKDVTEKLLADYNDVFADIVNVLLFDGKQIVAADDLETVKDRSQYKADGRIHEQERDVSKLLKSGKTTITLFGFEHQTATEKFMPVRQIGYDGQSYRAQLLHEDPDHIYPVITLVLYFGTTPWNYSHHLTDDRRFEEIIQKLPGKGGTSMCTVLDKVENKGREEEKLEGMIQVYYKELH